VFGFAIRRIWETRVEMAVAGLYRVNFVLAGSARSLLKLLFDPPTVGDQLGVENISLIVTGVKPEPADKGVVATVSAIVDGGSDAT
jgi:hypothetical protein